MATMYIGYFAGVDADGGETEVPFEVELEDGLSLLEAVTELCACALEEAEDADEVHAMTRLSRASLEERLAALRLVCVQPPLDEDYEAEDEE